MKLLVFSDRCKANLVLKQGGGIKYPQLPQLMWFSWCIGLAEIDDMLIFLPMSTLYKVEDYLLAYPIQALK